jgi:hypothetical protein
MSTIIVALHKSSRLRDSAEEDFLDAARADLGVPLRESDLGPPSINKQGQLLLERYEPRDKWKRRVAWRSDRGKESEASDR